MSAAGLLSQRNNDEQYDLIAQINTKTYIQKMTFARSRCHARDDGKYHRTGFKASRPISVSNGLQVRAPSGVGEHHGFILPGALTNGTQRATVAAETGRNQPPPQPSVAITGYTELHGVSGSPNL